MASEVVQRHNQIVLDSLQEGDLVEFPRARGVYSHWAVYIAAIRWETDEIHGNGEVVHFGKDDNAQQFKVSIRKDKFFKAAGSSKASRRNDMDNKIKPLPSHEIVENAKSKVSKTGYNFLFTNCQHFATWCRYGKAISDQVKWGLRWGSKSVIGTFVIGTILCGAVVLVVGGFLFCTNKIQLP